MTFKIVDGREYFYQWDINRQIIVDDPSITEVHFCNRMDNCSLVVEVVDGIANVPNILLQNGFSIRVFAYDGQATMYERVFEVKARTKPIDYIYEEVEIVRYEDLSKRLNALEEGLENKVAEEVNKYIEENPVEVDLSNYYTKEEVDTAVENVEVDLTDYYTKGETADLINDMRECSTHYFNPYAIEWQAGITPTPAPEDLTKFAQKFLAGESVNLFIAYEKNEDIRWIPAEFYVDSNNRVVFRRTLSHGDFGKEIEIQNYLVYYNETRELWVVKKDGGSYVYFYPDKKYVDEAIANLDIPEGGDVDLSNYYTKDEVDDLLSNAPSGGLTEEEVQELINNTLAGLDGDEVEY